VSPRPAVDVVVPFRGPAAQLDQLAERLGTLALCDGDSVTIADNRPGATDSRRGAVDILGAGERQTSYHARNRADANQAPWLVFIDADVVAPPDLLDRYFAQPPADETGVLSGAVVDETPLAEASDGNPAMRYAYLKSSMSQEITLTHEGWPFAQTANAAVRRQAFAQVGGFEAGIRSGGDADLCFRLRAAGWALERREQAAVVHRNCTTIARMLGQRVRHGAGAAWLSRRWPRCRGGAGPAWPCGAPAAPCTASKPPRAAIATRRCSACSTDPRCGRSSSGGWSPTAPSRAQSPPAAAEPGSGG